MTVAIGIVLTIRYFYQFKSINLGVYGLIVGLAFYFNNFSIIFCVFSIALDLYKLSYKSE